MANPRGSVQWCVVNTLHRDSRITSRERRASTCVILSGDVMASLHAECEITRQNKCACTGDLCPVLLMKLCVSVISCTLSSSF